jgi:pyrimidine deaminase RibD-like protein
MKISELNKSDYEIRNYHKLDLILSDLCKMVIAGQKKDKDYGMVAACVLDVDNNIVARTSKKVDGKWSHAERNAISAYEKKYGKIPEGSIIITTCSPCSETMDDRYGESCTDLINQSPVKKVYSGYEDPTQPEEDREYNEMVTKNKSIRDLCKKFAATFLDKEKKSLT